MVSPGASLLALQMAFFWLCPQMIFVLCRSIPGTSSSSSKDTSQVGLESTLVTSFDLFLPLSDASLVTQMIKNLPAMQETQET